MQAGGLPGELVGAELAGARLCRRGPTGCTLVQPLGQFGMGLAWRRQFGQLVAPLGQHGLDHAVHQQIGVTPDRAGEVGVGLVRESEVSAVDRGVDRLLHGAQKHRMDLLSVGPVLGGLGNLLELAGFGVVAERQADTDSLQVVAQDFLLLGGRSFMHAKQPLVLALGNEVGTAHVGGEHRLLDQPVRLVAGSWHDLLDAAVIVTDDLGLGGLEVDRTALRARSQQRPVHVVQVQQIADAGLAPGSLGASRIGQNRGHFGVGEARMAEHHRRIKLVRMDLARSGDEHVAHHAQPLDFRVERTQAVGQLLRQHRDHPAREVDRRGAVVSIHVDGAARFHVMADIRNGHQQPPAFATTDPGRLAIDGIVEVAGVFAVDRHQGNVGQVDTVFPVLRPNLVRQGPGLGNAGFGELMRHAVLANRDFDLHARVVDLAQHLLDPAHRLPEQGRGFGQLDHHHLARLAGTGGRFGDQNILAVALVFRRHDPDAVFVQQATDDRMRGALDDLQHTPFGATFSILPHDPHPNLVLVQHRAHLVRRQVDVGAAVFANQKPVPVAMALHRTFNFVQQTAGGVDILDI